MGLGYNWTNGNSPRGPRGNSARAQMDVSLYTQLTPGVLLHRRHVVPTFPMLIFGYTLASLGFDSPRIYILHLFTPLLLSHLLNPEQKRGDLTTFSFSKTKMVAVGPPFLVIYPPTHRVQPLSISHSLATCKKTQHPTNFPQMPGSTEEGK